MATSLYEDADIPFIYHFNYKNGRLNTGRPTMLMIYWEKCDACTKKAPSFINNKDSSKWKVAAIEVGSLTDEATEDLQKLTNGDYQGLVPFMAMFDKNGVYKGEYEQGAINGGCFKYEYHCKINGECDASKC